MIQVYGIPNCDTVKKALQWLDAQGHAYAFHNFKKSPPSPEQASTWFTAVGADQLINRRGTTWKQLTDAERAGATDPQLAIALIETQPSLIKRPLVQWSDGSWSVGFSTAAWTAKNQDLNA